MCQTAHLPIDLVPNGRGRTQSVAFSAAPPGAVQLPMMTVGRGRPVEKVTRMPGMELRIIDMMHRFKSTCTHPEKNMIYTQFRWISINRRVSAAAGSSHQRLSLSWVDMLDEIWPTDASTNDSLGLGKVIFHMYVWPGSNSATCMPMES